MTDYKRLYTHLFNALTDAVGAVEQQDFGTAKAVIVRAQQETEEMYLGSAEKD